jgi:hypothetical protein
MLTKYKRKLWTRDATNENGYIWLLLKVHGTEIKQSEMKISLLTYFMFGSTQHNIAYLFFLTNLDSFRACFSEKLFFSEFVQENLIYFQNPFFPPKNKI